MWESPHNRQQCRMLGKEEDDGMKKAGEDMEQEECERLKENILKIMQEDSPMEKIVFGEYSDRKGDGTTQIRVEVGRYSMRGEPDFVTTNPKRVDAWRNLLKVVQTAHGMSTSPDSN